MNSGGLLLNEYSLLIERTADPSAALGACDFFDLACSSWLESLEEHLPTSIAGVPLPPPFFFSTPRHKPFFIWNRSARRFAQDDGFA